MNIGRTDIALALGILMVPNCVPARGDVNGETLLKQIRVAERSANTLSATYTVDKLYSGDKNQERGSVSMKKPLMMRLQVADAQHEILVSDGKHYKVVADGKVAYGGDATIHTLDLGNPTIILFYGAGTSSDIVLSTSDSVRYVGTELIGGVKCEVVELAFSKPSPFTIRVSANPSHIVVRWRQVTVGPSHIGLICTFNNLKVNKDLPSSLFALPK